MDKEGTFILVQSPKTGNWSVEGWRYDEEMEAWGKVVYIWERGWLEAHNYKKRMEEGFKIWLGNCKRAQEIWEGNNPRANQS